MQALFSVAKMLNGAQYVAIVAESDTGIYSVRFYRDGYLRDRAIYHTGSYSDAVETARELVTA